MVNLIKPRFLLPIGGTFRHMEIFSRMCRDMGYDRKQIFEMIDGQILEIGKEHAKVSGLIEVHNVFVDGLGIGDVGNIVLRDRQKMSEEGIVVVVVALDQHTGKITSKPDVYSRGFIFEDLAPEIIDEAKDVVAEALEKHSHKISDWRFVRRVIEDSLEKFFYQITERRPLILPLVVEV